MPRIGLLATLLSTTQSYRGAGIHTYCHQLLQHLPEQCKQTELLAYVADANYQTSSGVLLRKLPARIQNPFARIIWEQSALPLAARRDHLDLLHGLAYAVPITTSVPTIVTVHDLSFILYPEAFRRGNRQYLSRITSQSCRRARRVIAVSEATARDLVQILNISADKIDVVYNGVDSRFRPLSDAEVSAYRSQAGWPERFILMLGTLEPRKNHLMVLEAYAQYRRLAHQPLPLLIGGGKGWYYDTIFQRAEALHLEEHVHFLGFVPSEALPWLYNAASLFVYPSRYEGFGLPLAEAMSCGTPAITSTASSLPEVAGAAAVTIEPDDPAAMAQAMAQVLDSPGQMQRLREAGLKQSKRFRWPITAKETAAVYTRVLEGLDG